MTEMKVSNAHEVRCGAVQKGYERGFSFIRLAGKRPVDLNWTRLDRADLKQALEWAQRGNIGLRTGQASGVVVLDVDEGGDVSALNLPETVTVITGGGGRHYYFVAPSFRTKNSASKLGEKIDFRGDGGQVVYPGSIHPDTQRVYEWAPGRALGEVAIAPLPEALVELVRCPEKSKQATPQLRSSSARTTPYGRAALAGEVQKVRSAVRGTRNDTLNLSSFKTSQLVSGGEVDREEAMSALQSASTLDDPDEVLRTIESGMKAGEQYPRSAPVSDVPRKSKEESPALHCTDVGNGKRLVRGHGQDLRYCSKPRGWYVWQGDRWGEDLTGEVERRAKETVRALYLRAYESTEEEVRKKLSQWATSSESMQRIEAMIKAARSELGMSVQLKEFDTDPWLLNVKNGTLDLRTLQLREHNREDLITKIVDVEYDPSAKCPLWLSFLNRVMQENKDLIAFIQRIMGYVLTGETCEQCFFIFWGQGANGKSVFLNVMRRLLSDYAAQAPSGTFLVRRTDAPTNDLADMRGARLVTLVETEDGQRLAEGLIKQVTGQDALTVRQMYKKFFTYTPTFKLILATNHRPTIQGTGLAIWRRVKLIPFEVTIPKEEQNHNLTNELMTELPGILAWIVEGCREWRARGLDDPDEVKAATEQYRESEDRVGQFLKERCVGQPDAVTSSRDLYAAYKTWCSTHGEDAASQRRFGEALANAGYQRRKSGTIHWVGLSLRPEPEVER